MRSNVASVDKRCVAAITLRPLPYSFGGTAYIRARLAVGSEAGHSLSRLRAVARGRACWVHQRATGF